MKFKKLLSCFLSVAMCMSMFTALPLSASAEAFSDTVTQTVFELSADDIKSGNIPAYVNVNTAILDRENTSAANGVLSTTTDADTDFIQIDLAAAARALPGTDLDQYTVEIVTNAVDSDSATKNGTIMYANGNADKLLLRNREGSDVTTNKNDWSDDQYKGATTITKAYYTITDLKLSDGTATSHKATYDTATASGTNLFSGVANGQALTAWAKAPIRGITVKSAAGYRANITKLKITRNVNFSSENYVKSEQTVFEMNADTLKAGTVPAGVTLNTTILNSSASSASAGLISSVVAADTEFLKLDFAKLTENLLGYDTGIYKIELVTNLNDSESATKNGTLMYIDGAASKFAFRARESSDFCVMNASWEQPAWNATTADEAHYTITGLDLSTGAAESHLAQRKSGTTFSNQYSSTATGETLNAANAPITGITFKAANGYRANIASLKITRQAYIENIKYTITAVAENAEHGTVAIAGLTDGKVQKGNTVTLTATAKDGYIFKGWYKQGTETPVTTDLSYTFVAVENANYVAKFVAAREVTQTVYEMDIEALAAGIVPQGVALNTEILNEDATSAQAGLVSDTMAAQTAFLTLNLKELSKNLPGEDTGLYTIEVVANQNDSDSTTSNGVIMSMTGTAKKDVWRVRESADIAVLNTWTSANSIFSSGNKSAATASYVFTDLDVNTGSMASHAAKYGTATVYSGYANGQAVAAGNASVDTPINIIEFRTALTSSSGAMRVNLKSLKITRKALVPAVTCTINATTENEERGTVEITGVSTEEETLGQVQSGNEVTLTATRNPGYLFKGWYKGDSDVPVSTDSVYTFKVEESANYTARFVESYIANKVVYEMDVESLEEGTVPNGVTLATSILDETATTADALVSDVMAAADTAFLTIDLAKVGINAGDIGGDIYTIELVTNVNDSDDTTSNGTLMNLKGTSDVLVFRAREDSDICALNNSGWTSGLYWRTETAVTASYKMENLNVTTGAATAHWLMRGNVIQHTDNANGQALGAGNATEETPISILTVKAAKGRRANIKSLKITRQVELPLERVNVEVTTENDSYGIVTDIGDTAIKYSEITLTAEAKEGYIFAGWYNGNELVSEEDVWTFQVLESFSYTARFRKVIEEWVEVYGMNIADILAGNNTNGVVISNLDTTNSSAANGLLSAESDASQDFMTITFASLPAPEIAENDVLTDIYRVDMKFNLVDEDDTTKNGALVYYNEAKSANMIARMRETRDGTFYKDGSATIYGGTIGSQKIPSLAYNFKIDTNTGLFNQYVKHGVGDYYLFADTASRGDDITLPETPNKIIIRNADYNSGGVNENYRVNIKSLSVKRLVKVVDTGNAVPMFSKDRVSVIAKNGEIWSGFGEFTTDVDKIIIDFGSEVESSQITNDTVFITCNDEKIESTATAITGVDGITLVTITGMTFEDGKTYKIIADGIKNTRGASLQKLDEYVAISTKASYASIFVKSASIGGTTITGASDITANTDITVNVAYSNVAGQKDVYVLYVAYKGDTKADVKIGKLENVSGNGNQDVTITTGNVTDVEEIDFIIWEGWSTMKILDSFGF